MGKKEVIFKVDMETGEVEMEAIGFSGSECKKFTKPYEDALGTVTDRTMKSVAWRNQATEGGNRINVNGGNW